MHNYQCEVCAKPYISFDACKKHEHMCKLENCQEKQIKLTEDDYQGIIRQMLQDINKLKTEVKELKGEHDIDYKIYKKNFIPEKWLHENLRTYQDLEEWIETIDISSEQMHYITNDYIMGVLKILPEIINCHCPIKSFDIKSKKIYVKSDDIWRELRDRDIDVLCNNIQNKLVIVWEKEKREKHIEDIFYEHTLTGGRHKYEKIKINIQNAVYKIVNLKLKSLIEYKFTE